MLLRSLLFVPGDRPDRMEKALDLNADALILDLEDSVLASVKNHARQNIRAFLASEPKKTVFVRINAVDTVEFDEDVSALQGVTAAGLVIPKFHVSQLEDSRLKDRLPASIPLIGQAAEGPLYLPFPDQYQNTDDRLIALTWGAEDLTASLGIVEGRPKGHLFASPLELARNLTLFSARAAGLEAIETVFPDIGDVTGLAEFAKRARNDGFTGMLAIHPNQISTINQAFTPTAEEIALSEKIQKAFSDEQGLGAVNIDGKMFDLAHLKSAQSILKRAKDCAI